MAVTAARLAADVIRAHAGRLAREAVRSKARHDLVTDIDVESERLIVEMLRRAFPDDDVLAEEGHDTRDGTGDDRPTWIIDPIDGTTNFTRGVPPYAVSIGLRDGGEMKVGVVLDVSHDELFTAVRGEGLFVDGERAWTSPTPRLDEGLVTTGFPYRAVEHVDTYLDVLGTFMRGTRGVRRPGSASVDLAWVACGRFDGFFETGLRAWDVAAGMLLVEEGGGRVTDFSGAADPLFAAQVVASNGHVHEAMLDAVYPLRGVRS